MPPSRRNRRVKQDPDNQLKKAVKLREFYPTRSNDVRKGDFGRVVICGGSDRYAGCLAFNALAALRAGADLAIVVAPRRAADIVAGYSPDLITVPCDTPFPDPDVTIELLENADSLVMGCGVTRTPDSHRALMDIIQQCKTPMVLDAEALHAIATTPDTTKGKQALLTPNAGEYHDLSKSPWPENIDGRRTAVQSLARQYKTTVIVKGAVDF